MGTDETESNQSNQTTTTKDDHHYPMWHNLLAGGVAGAGARFATAPLDLLRIRYQLDSTVTYPRPTIWSSATQIIQTEGGVGALFRGTVAATYLWIGYSAVQFALYARVRRWIEAQDDPMNPHPTLIAFVAGGSAGAFATLATYPFDLCRTIFAARGLQQPTTATTASFAPSSSSSTTFSPPKSLHEFTLVMYRQKGIKGFFAGSGPAVIQIIPYMGLNFAIYDRLTTGDKRVAQSGVAGSISGGVSKMLVYPMDTIKKRLQAQAAFDFPMRQHYYTGMIDCLVVMWKTEGITSFYRGLVPAVLKTTMATGLSFGLYRFTKNVLESIHGDGGPYVGPNNKNNGTTKQIPT